jgi:hypothetical protein
MLCVTVWWVHNYGQGGNEYAEPCTHPFFARLKATAFLSATWICIWVLVFSSDPANQKPYLSVALPVGWAMAAAIALAWHLKSRKMVQKREASILNLDASVQQNGSEACVVSLGFRRRYKYQSKLISFALNTSDSVVLENNSNESKSRYADLAALQRNAIASCNITSLYKLTDTSGPVYCDLRTAVETMFDAIAEDAAVIRQLGVVHFQTPPSYVFNMQCSNAQNVFIEGLGAGVCLTVHLFEFGFQKAFPDNEKAATQQQPYPYGGLLITASARAYRDMLVWGSYYQFQLAQKSVIHWIPSTVLYYVSTCFW